MTGPVPGGAEIILNKTLETLGLSFDVNYTYLDARDQETAAKLAASHTLNTGMTYKHEALSTSLSSQTIAGRPKNSMGDELEGYTVVDGK